MVYIFSILSGKLLLKKFLTKQVISGSQSFTEYKAKTYIGETVYWLDEKLNLNSACLATTWVKGHYTYDLLEKIIRETHVKLNFLVFHIVW